MEDGMNTKTSRRRETHLGAKRVDVLSFVCASVELVLLTVAGASAHVGA